MEIVLFATKMEGMFDVVLDIVINDFHVYEVTITGLTVSKSLKLDKKSVYFEQNENYQFIDIYNPFNIIISYNWDIPQCSFDVDPLSGTVLPKKHIICAVKYHPYKLSSAFAEFTLLADGRINHLIRVSAETRKLGVTLLDPEVKLKNIALNLPQVHWIRIKNNTSVGVYFIINEPEPIPGIKISPSDGIICQDSIESLKLCIQMTECITFNTSIVIQVQKKLKLTVNISGNVVAPQIVIKPKVINFRKIVSQSFDRAMFVMQNCSSIEATIQFKIDDYKEYLITNSLNTKDITGMLLLYLLNLFLLQLLFQEILLYYRDKKNNFIFIFSQLMLLIIGSIFLLL